MSESSDVWLICPGDAIAPEAGLLRGHGTYVSHSLPEERREEARRGEEREGEDSEGEERRGEERAAAAQSNISSGMLVSALAGRVERINRLVSVKGISGRYVGEVGDIVVGRIKEVSAKRWKVDVSARQDAVLLLSSVYLTGDQRRRTLQDALQMRQYFAENDVIAAEVHSVLGDGSLALQSRSIRFGKCCNGLLIQVHPASIRRLKQHLVTLPCGVDMVIGVNGWIWMNEAVDLGVPAAVEGDVDVDDELAARKAAAVSKPVTPATRLVLSRLHNSIVALREGFMPVSPDTIMQVYDASVAAGFSPKDMLDAKAIERLQSVVTH